MNQRLPARVIQMKWYGYVIAVVACGVLLPGCERQSSSPAVRVIRLATTTSTENSGLLDVLLPAFQRRTGIVVHVLAMGTGQALQTARDGNCDVVLVHAPQAEEQFVAAGWGVDPRPVIYNDFLFLGPAADPAGLKGVASPVTAVQRISATKSLFVSRGDNSGTYAKEEAFWQAARVRPVGKWYRSVGKGMGQTLIMADEMNAYVLVDRGTYVKFRKRIQLVPLLAGDRTLHNPYSVIAVNPARHRHVKYDDVMKFIDFLVSEECRALVGGYRLDGEILFHPWPKQPPRPAGGTGAESS